MTEELGDRAEEEDFTVASDEIFALASYSPSGPSRRRFMPWHKPRKQHVRSVQWGEAYRDASDRARARLNRELRYLSLPGPDMLDLRFLHSEYCGDIDLAFLGFDETATPGSDFHEQHNVSLTEVRSLPRVNRRSSVVPYDFRRLSIDNFVAFDRVREFAPYDVINLDMCGHFGSDGRVNQSLYNALQRLFSLQTAQLDPWSFLLTTRVGHDGVSGHVKQAFLDRIRSLLDRCEGFSERLEASFPLIARLDALSDLDNLSREDFFVYFSLGLGCWLIDEGIAMRQEVRLKSVFAYRVEPQAPYLDMASYAFVFTPTLDLPPDSVGLVSRVRREMDECALASALVRSASAVADVDQLLLDDEVLKESLVDDLANLLEKARYDPSDFRNWVGAGCPPEWNPGSA